MGTKYTITAGAGNQYRYEYRTNCLTMALYKLFTVKIDYKVICWKQLQIR